MQHFNLFLQKKYEKLQWRLWEKLSNALNRHNSCYVENRVVNFGSMYGFRGRPI